MYSAIVYTPYITLYTLYTCILAMNRNNKLTSWGDKFDIIFSALSSVFGLC